MQTIDLCRTALTIVDEMSAMLTAIPACVEGGIDCKCWWIESVQQRKYHFQC
jgi:hypothetical protein